MSNDFGGFSLSDLKDAQDPYALLDAARKAGGALGKINGVWLALGRSEAFQILRSRNGKTGFIAEMYRQQLPPGAARDEMAHRLNFLDPPAHTRLRALLQMSFTTSRVAALRPYLEALCAARIDAMLEKGGDADLIGAYAHEIPSLAVSELLGVPGADRDQLTVWAESVAGLLGFEAGEERDLALSHAEEMRSYLRALMEERRRAPQDDLLTAMIQAETDGDSLKEEELISLAATLFSAGNRTTRDMFSNGVAVLLQHPEILKRYAAGEIPAEAMIKEFLRFETPTFYVVRMFDDAENIGETTIPGGEMVIVMLAAANRDPDAYERADLFDPSRWTKTPPPPPVMSFAQGPHFCLGMNLALLEAEVMFATLMRRCPNIRLAGRDLRYRHTGLFRSLEALPVALLG